MKLQGLKGASLGTLTLNDVGVDRGSLIGRPDGGAQVFRQAMLQERILLSAFLVGSMRRALIRSSDYAKSRHQFGVPIATHQYVSGRIVEMLMRYATAKLLLEPRDASDLPHGAATEADASLVKLYASEGALECQLERLPRAWRQGAGGRRRQLRRADRRAEQPDLFGNLRPAKGHPRGLARIADMSRHLASYLFDAASLWGERPACADASGTHSYNDYLNEALRVAALLRRAGVEAGDRVCISAPKSFSLYASLFGTLMLNACYVPIDYTVPAGRGRKIIADCAPAALITTGAQSGEAAWRQAGGGPSSRFPRIC